ncbi:MAG: YihY/virulence factor BrkB family protein [Alphaproteobacteria bacterium]|nr:YihY/virulence factor BrkB family protein [Alphaproteobacteria bacterium]
MTGVLTSGLGWCRTKASRGWAIATRVLGHLWDDGFIHAGNLAYLSLLTLFPFFIVVAAVAGSFGRTEDGLQAVSQFLATLPPDVAKLLAAPISDVLSKRSGAGLLTLGLIVGLWSVGSFIETMRDILRRAYDVQAIRPFWQYRLGSIAIIFGSVVLMLVAFASQVVLTGVEQFVSRLLPFADDVLATIGITRLAPIVALFVALYLLFLTLTPHEYRRRGIPKWPGAVLTTAVWILTTMLLPQALALLAPYDLTYGSLAGVMIALIFFWIVGLGFVLGAELNAALAEIPKSRQKGGVETAETGAAWPD